MIMILSRAIDKLQRVRQRLLIQMWRSDVNGTTTRDSTSGKRVFTISIFILFRCWVVVSQILEDVVEKLISSVVRDSYLVFEFLYI